MKKFLMALLVAAGACASFAGDGGEKPAWMGTLGKVTDMWADTGLCSFGKQEAPAYITGNFAEADRPAKKPLAANRNGYYDKGMKWHGGYFDDGGRFVEGHEVHVLGGMRYGIGQLIMIPICLVLLYLAIVKGFEPLLLLPIGFGGLLANCPLAGVTAPAMLHDGVITFLESGIPVMQGGIVEPGGFLYYFFRFGIDTGVFPIMIFMGVGAMTDFGPLIANPKAALLGGAAQFGIFFALFGALGIAAIFGQDFFGCDPLKAAASIGIIGGADGPTAIWLTSRLAPDLLGAIAVAAYSYMALVPIIQPFAIKLVTTKKERRIRMPYNPKNVSRTLRICFPILVTIIAGFIAPMSVSLVGFLMFGNLLRECGCLDRLSETAQNALANLITLLLGITISFSMRAEEFVKLDTLIIMGLGLIAFVFDSIAGVMFAKLLNLFSRNKVNPMVGAAGISAFPMSARVIQKMGLEADPQNHLLMHAVGANVAGQIASVLAGGMILNLVPQLLK